MTAKVWSDKKCTATLSGHSDALMAVAIQPEAEGGVTRKAFRASQCECVSVRGSFSGAGAGILHFFGEKTMMNTDQYIPVLVGEVMPTMASHGCTHYLQHKATCHTSKRSMEIIKVRKNQMLRFGFLRLSTKNITTGFKFSLSCN